MAKKKVYGVGVRKDSYGNYYAMWLSFDHSFDLVEFFSTFLTARVCDTKTEAIVAAAEANEQFRTLGLAKEV